MNFPIVIHKDRRSAYGVTVPDLPGCFSAGRTVEEAIAGAREAIELHLEGLLELGQSFRASGFEAYQDDEQYANGIWRLVKVDRRIW